MTTLSLERLILPRRPATPAIRTAFIARATMIGKSIRAAREFDSTVSSRAQLRVMERFASSIPR